jgi:hypothetical protein
VIPVGVRNGIAAKAGAEQQATALVQRAAAHAALNAEAT